MTAATRITELSITACSRSAMALLALSHPLSASACAAKRLAEDLDRAMRIVSRPAAERIAQGAETEPKSCLCCMEAAGVSGFCSSQCEDAYWEPERWVDEGYADDGEEG